MFPIWQGLGWDSGLQTSCFAVASLEQHNQELCKAASPHAQD